MRRTVNSLGVAGVGKSEASQVERRNASVIADILSYTGCWRLSSHKCTTLVGISGCCSLGGVDVVARHAEEVELV